MTRDQLSKLCNDLPVDVLEAVLTYGMVDVDVPTAVPEPPEESYDPVLTQNGSKHPFYLRISGTDTVVAGPDDIFRINISDHPRDVFAHNGPVVWLRGATPALRGRGDFVDWRRHGPTRPAMVGDVVLGANYGCKTDRKTDGVHQVRFKLHFLRVEPARAAVYRAHGVRFACVEPCSADGTLLDLTRPLPKMTKLHPFTWHTRASWMTLIICLVEVIRSPDHKEHAVPICRKMASLCDGKEDAVRISFDRLNTEIGDINGQLGRPRRGPITSTTIGGLTDLERQITKILVYFRHVWSHAGVMLDEDGPCRKLGGKSSLSAIQDMLREYTGKWLFDVLSSTARWIMTNYREEVPKTGPTEALVTLVASGCREFWFEFHADRDKNGDKLFRDNS